MAKLLHIFTVFVTPQSFFDGQFKYLTDEGNEIVLVSSPHEGEQEFAERNGIRFIPVEIPRSVAPKKILSAIRAIIGIIKKEQPDAVFGHTPVAALCAMIASYLCRVKNRIYYRHGVIYTTMDSTGSPTGKLKKFIFKTEERFVSALATEIVNVSHSLSKLAVADKLNPESKQHVIGHGTCGGIDAQNIFNPALLKAERLEAIADGLGLSINHKPYTINPQIIFGFSGRICKDKGVPELVDAFELFQKRHSDVKVKLMLIGGHDVRDRLSAEKQRQIDENKDIIAVGHVDMEEYPYYVSMLDVFIFPSHREGFGMAVLEASAMEKPVLVSRSHGCVDSIVEHVTGEYIGVSEGFKEFQKVPEGLKAESICHGMELMMDDSARRFLGRNGRQKVLEWYDFRVMWPLVSELYNKILN